MPREPKQKGGGNDDPRIIDATPTKQLFIAMLTRDIGLIPAIVDLVDNCADGARGLRGNRSYKDLWARIELSQKAFRISDNCGGIPIDVARDYAFRFGRDEDAPAIEHSIGQFGVGMKRAVFKLGRAFHIESATKTSRFTVSHDVDKWAKDPKWEFRFAHVEEGIRVKEDEQGTTIVVKKLLPEVAGKFGLGSFSTELSLELKRRLQITIDKGLAVTVNQIPITAQPLTLLSDKKLAPAYRRLRFSEKGKKAVVVKLYCGLGASDKAAAGWHVFCNGRLVLGADKSVVTGWGETKKASGIDIPGFHNQYTRLRGYAYFDSDDPGRLPWNTTKTGIDMDSGVYRNTRLEMMRLMRPVVDFLNRLKDEKQELEEGAGPLETMVANSKSTPLSDISTRNVFNAPMPPQPKKPKVQRIQYDRPLEQVEKARQVLKVNSFKAVGEKTFDYFYANEVAS